jgi:hypothetical protein
MVERSFDNRIKGAQRVDSLPKRKKYVGPEADAYDRLKGQDVYIESIMSDPDGNVVEMRGRLKWVDHYTIGIMAPPKNNHPEREVIVYKHCIATIQAHSEKQ